jgi:hypothetical protein
MGLAERRVIHDFETNQLPALQSLPIEANWETLAPEGESHLYSESWKAVYFEPLIAALHSVGADEMGREALKKGLRRVIIANTRGNYYSDRWPTLEGSVLTLDDEPITNIQDVQGRTARLISVLEVAC